MKWLLPPILWILCVFAMFGLRDIAHIASLLPAPWHMVGIACLIIGLGITIAGSRKFRIVGTNILTFNKPDTLVTDGLFAISRNPMYLGFVISLLGVALWMNTVSALLPLTVFFLATQFWYIPYEEKMARQVFSEAYDAYCARVRRWL